MRKQVLYTEGITGISVEINHPEMIVLKGMAERCRVMIDPENMFNVEEAKSLLGDMAQFIDNFLPENVLSLEGAYEGLFRKP